MAIKIIAQRLSPSEMNIKKTLFVGGFRQND